MSHNNNKALIILIATKKVKLKVAKNKNKKINNNNTNNTNNDNNTNNTNSKNKIKNNKLIINKATQTTKFPKDFGQRISLIT